MSVHVVDLASLIPPDSGSCEGDICGRDGCKGVIELHDTDGCCSCHISPPCSHCTTPREYCPVCDWDAQEEAQMEWQESLERQKLWLASPEGLVWQKREIERQEKAEAQDKRFWQMFSGEIPVDEFTYRKSGHTHFSMRVHGVFTPADSVVGKYSTSLNEEAMKQIEGTFGGRFEQIGTQSFIYIAYTD